MRLGVWYEMLTGRLPLHAHTYEGWMRAHLEQVPEPPSKFNPALTQYPGVDALVLKLLAKDRERRPRDGQAFLEELNLIEARLSSNHAVVTETRMNDDDATILEIPTLFRFQTPPPSQSASAAPFGSFFDRQNPAASVSTTPSRRGSRTPWPDRWTVAGVAVIVIFGVIYRSQRNRQNFVVVPGRGTVFQPLIPAPSNPPAGISYEIDYQEAQLLRRHNRYD